MNTIPFDRVKIKLISIHLNDFHLNETFDKTSVNHSVDDYQKMITQFLKKKYYKLVKVYDKNYMYRLTERSNSISRVSNGTSDSSEQ